jgi:hypothetical protein
VSREAVPYYSVRELTSHFVVDCQPLNEGRKLGIASALHHAKRKWHVPLSLKCFNPPGSPSVAIKVQLDRLIRITHSPTHECRSDVMLYGVRFG